MKQLIIEALQSVDIHKGINRTKNVSTFLSIEGLTVAELLAFISDKDIPDTARISTLADWQGDYIQHVEAALEWTIQVPTTEQEQEKQRKTSFERNAWKAVYNKLTSNGYKRTPYDSSQHSRFRNIVVYDLFVSGDYDTLTGYYSLFFKPL